MISTPLKFGTPASRAGLLAAIALLLTLFGPGSSHAQPLPGMPGPAAAEATAPPEVPPAYRSARATMRTFLEGVVGAAESEGSDRARLMAQAVGCLDLSGLTAGVRAELADDLAIKLKEVIDRVRFVIYEAIPDDPAGQPWLFHRVKEIQAEIIIERTADGRWLFSKATVDQIPELYRHYEMQPKVAGVVDSGVSMSPALWLRSKMPDELRGRWLLMEHWQWLILLSLILIGWLIGRIIRAVLAGPVRHFLEARSFRVPNRLITRVLEPLNLVAMGLVWMAGIRYIGLPPSIATIAIVLFKFLAAFGVIRIALRAVAIVTHVLAERAKLTPNKFDDLAVPFFDKTAKVVVFAIGILFMADVFGVSPASLLAGLGLGGLAVALAAQDTVKNLFGSFTVILDRPFEVGDGIKLSADVQGTVEEVGFRSTRIRSWDNTLITVPNGNLIAANVENLGNRTFFRYRAFLNITYDTPPDRVEAFCKGIEELIRLHPDTRKEAFYCRFAEFGAASLDLLVVAHFRAADMATFIAQKHSLLLGILNLADRLGVDFAFPTSTVHLMNAGESPKAARRQPVPHEVYAGARELGLREATGLVEAARPPAPVEAEGPTDTEV